MVMVTLKIQMFVNEINGIVTWLAQIPDFLFNQNNIIVRGAKKQKDTCDFTVTVMKSYYSDFV